MKLPSFSLPASDKKTYTEADFASGVFVLYLYPKDMTPGCTLEANDFQSLLPEFEKLGAQALGMSKDSIERHEKFCTKESLTFPLITDAEMTLIEPLGAWVEKSMYGKKYMGIDRSTFIIKDGEVVHEWRKVKAKGHASAVLDWLQGADL